MDTILQLDYVGVLYRGPNGVHQAADGVSFALPRGSSLCLVGESGSGKTTIALAIPRLLPATSIVDGRICFAGRDLLNATRQELYEVRRRQISVIFQDSVGSMIPGVRVGKQITRVISHRCQLADSNALARRSRELLEAVGLEDVERILRSYPRELSGGMCQRVMIALALSADPSLLIADEPVSSLDAITQVRVLDLLFRLKEQHGYSMLFVTHDLRVAARFDQIGVLRRGKLVEVGSAHQVLSNPGNEYTRELLDAVRTLSTVGSGESALAQSR